jgi:hypothetical protein
LVSHGKNAINTLENRMLRIFGPERDEVTESWETA